MITTGEPPALISIHSFTPSRADSSGRGRSGCYGIATSRGLANARIEIKQDLIAETRDAFSWAERIARLMRPILADRGKRAPADFGETRAAHRRGKPASAT